jgi:hypothetical protein
VTVAVGDWAPIALFIYRRPDHARRMITSVQACVGYSESPVFVFADGPARAGDRPGALETRALARSLLGDRAVFVERDDNLGVDRSIIDGVSNLCDRFGRVIVIEDDLVVAPRFLEFLNGGLQRYEHESKVMQVSGYMFDVPPLRQQAVAVLLPMTTSWGWATWKRAWAQFDPLATGWEMLLEDERVRRRFDLDGRFAYSRMLAGEMGKDVGAWDIRWYYSVFARDGLVLFPPRTLVTNAGFDGSGTHDRLALPARQAPLEMSASFALPSEIVETRHKEDVFRSIAAFRPTSVRGKVAALMKVALRRGGLA